MIPGDTVWEIAALRYEDIGITKQKLYNKQTT